MFDPNDHFRRLLKLQKLASREEEAIQRRWLSVREVLVWRAVAAAGHSTSYRPFPVGCAVWGFNPTITEIGRSAWQVHKGANIKVTKETPKVCSEMPAIMAAMQAGIHRIVGVALVGSPREEDLDDLLYPCEVCRMNMRKLPIIRADTHFILARPKDADSFSHILETTMGEIWEKFQTPRAD